jgi:hypothetical protein
MLVDSEVADFVNLEDLLVQFFGSTHKSRVAYVFVEASMHVCT